MFEIGLDDDHDGSSFNEHLRVDSVDDTSLTFPLDTTAIVLQCQFMADAFKGSLGLDLERTKVFIAISLKLDGGRALIHRSLSRYSTYSEQAADALIDEVAQGLGSQSPSCYAVNKTYGRCNTCPFQNTCNSPLELTSDETIETEADGFYTREFNKNGRLVKNSPHHEDMLRAFKKEHLVYTEELTGKIYVYKAKYWIQVSEAYVMQFARKRFKPDPSDKKISAITYVIKEFVNHLKDHTLILSKDEEESTHEKINLTNGVFDLKEMKLYEHSHVYRFKYILPYRYDETAIAPNFQKFLDEVMGGDYDLQQTIVQFVGYALFARAHCLAAKALIFFGDGANGKSTLQNMVQKLCGRENYSSMTLSDLKDPQCRPVLLSKHINFGDETNVKSLSDSEVFKTIVTGGEVKLKELYVQPYTKRITTKLIFSCNELPRSGDRSLGLYRRMIIIPFDQTFLDDEEIEDKKKFLSAEGLLKFHKKDTGIEERMSDELSGIFNMCIDGYKKLRDKDWKFTISQKSDKIIDQYRSENDNILSFCEEHVERDGDTERDFLYDKYKAYCEDNGFHVFNKKIFYKSVEKTFQCQTFRPAISVGDLVRRRKFRGIKYVDSKDD